MKARKKGTDNPYVDIDMIQLAGSDILYKQDDIEFQNNRLPRYEGDQHWLKFREEAAIAAMQALISAPVVDGIDSKPSQSTIAKWAVMQADELVKELLGRQLPF